MSASSFLPKTTDSITQVAKTGEVGITTPKLELPVMPSVASGDQVFENRMSATQALMKVGSGNLMGGGRKIKYKTHKNHIKKVMRGCNNNKRTKKYKNKRKFIGGANAISPSIVGNKVEVPIPDGATPDQIAVLKELTSGLLQSQTVNANIPPPAPALMKSQFSGGGGMKKKLKHGNKKTNHRKLRHKKSIARKSRFRSYKNRR
jgi:hypothetical protein